MSNAATNGATPNTTSNISPNTANIHIPNHVDVKQYLQHYKDRVITVDGYIVEWRVNWWYRQMTLEIDTSPDQYYTHNEMTIRRFIYWYSLPEDKFKPVDQIHLSPGIPVTVDILDLVIVGFR